MVTTKTHQSNWSLPFKRPNWVPKVADGTRILVTGASGGIGNAVVQMLLEGSDCHIGAQGNTNICDFKDPRVTLLNQKFDKQADCDKIIAAFADIAGGIDALVVLSGALHYTDHWMDIPENSWNNEIKVTLSHPFFLARSAMKYMKMRNNGGRILLTGTESSLHGGSANSFPYAIAKRGTECMVQGMAREGAPSNILVNGVRLGYIASGFHEKWHGRTQKQMTERAEMVPLKRAGHVDEAASLIVYLLSDWARFITGQMIPLTGGDWL